MSVALGTLMGDTTTDRGDTTMADDLPDFTHAGQPGDWHFEDRYGSETDLDGDFLGMGSSNRPFHKHAFPPYAEPKQHCSTCRWMEVRIFQENENPDGGERSGRYLIVRTGRSIVPDEETRTTFGYQDSGSGVVNALITWNDIGQGALPYVERRALEQAAQYDDSIREAYEAALRGVLA